MRKIALIALALPPFLWPNAVLAQGAQPARPSEPTIDFSQLEKSVGLKPGLANLGGIVSAFVPYVFGIAGIILLFYLIWGGFGVMTARGDPKAAASAQQRITTAIAGFVIIFIAYWLVQLLGLVLGIGQFGELFQ